MLIVAQNHEKYLLYCKENNLNTDDYLYYSSIEDVMDYIGSITYVGDYKAHVGYSELLYWIPQILRRGGKEFYK